jgi:hypothetical protein
MSKSDTYQLHETYKLYFCDHASYIALSNGLALLIPDEEYDIMNVYTYFAVISEE